MAPAEFFFANAGYSYNPETETPEQGRAKCAQRLAEAEAEADRRGWWVEWAEDGEEDGAPRWCALLRDSDNTILGSLGGIDVCDGPYARVVAAELAADMDIDTTARFARIKTDSADPGLPPIDALRLRADELQEKADRLARSFGQRLTPEQEQVKKDTGFTMDHLQALRHLQQRAELCRKAQK